MTQYIIQNDNEQFVAAYSSGRISWTRVPEQAKTFDSREAASAVMRKVSNRCHSERCWIAKLVRD